jgi:hypothetical protein
MSSHIDNVPLDIMPVELMEDLYGKNIPGDLCGGKGVYLLTGKPAVPRFFGAATPNLHMLCE